jgi:hypothetical protein
MFIRYATLPTGGYSVLLDGQTPIAKLQPVMSAYAVKAVPKRTLRKQEKVSIDAFIGFVAKARSAKL